MAWTEVIIECSSCRRESSLRMNEVALELTCRWCGKPLRHFVVRQSEGYLYVLSNRTMPELHCIGATTGLVEDYVRELSNAAAVPVAFEIEAFFSSDSLVQHKEKVYKILEERHVSKEFFEVGLEEAISIVADVSGGALAFMRDDLQSSPRKPMLRHGMRSDPDFALATFLCEDCERSYTALSPAERHRCPHCQSDHVAASDEE